ncbi:hypothetical protein MIR68_007332 [Amoeboaphelidium protococcarum]|nr:hypothetical protein MIR68_007332 [Amoeboaphelidium protococcarum]
MLKTQKMVASEQFAELKLLLEQHQNQFLRGEASDPHAKDNLIYMTVISTCLELLEEPRCLISDLKSVVVDGDRILIDFTSANLIGHQVSCINEQFELDVTELKSQWRLARGVIKDKRIASKDSSLGRSDQLGIEFALKKFAHGKVV